MFTLKGSRGFTLVEIIVVVAVVAILAAIVIAVYPGMIRRAHNAQTLTAVKSYFDALNSYRLANKAYPMPASGTYNKDDYFFRACLGTNYIDEPGFSDATANDKDCWLLKNDPYGTHPQSWLDDALKSDNLPNPYPSRSANNYGGPDTFVGAAIYFRGWSGAPTAPDAFTVNGKRHDYYMYYLLEGNERCGVGDVMAYDPAYAPDPYPHFITGGNYDYTERINGATMCMIMLPEP